MNRGSAHGRLAHRRQTAASMRPRFMNRGSPTARYSTASTDTGFNEAPIHESGKYSGRRIGRAGDLQLQ